MDLENLSENHKELLGILDAARILDCPEGEKIIEYIKVIGNYYFPHRTGTELKVEGSRAIACFLDLLIKGKLQTPEAFLENMEIFTQNWKS